MQRESKDKIVNTEGKQLIEWLNETGMGILNGVKDIAKEDYTYIGARGKTVIDYVIKRELEEEKKEKIEIRESLKSDHMKVIYSWEEMKEQNKEEEDENGKEYISWSKKDIKKYKECIRGIEDESNWKKIREKIGSALQWRKQKEPDTKNKREKWDKECVKKKKELIEILKEIKEYKWMIMRKKESNNIKIEKRNRGRQEYGELLESDK